MRRNSKIILFIVMLLMLFSLQSITFAAVDEGIVDLNLQQNGGGISNTIATNFKLTNVSGSDINLSDVEIRYYYTVDEDKKQNFFCDNAGITYQGAPYYTNITSAVNGSFVSTSENNSDTYLQITFTSGDLAIGATAGIQTRVARDDWTNYDQSNDFSFNNAENVAVYVDGELVWGPAGEPPIQIEPSAPVLNSATAKDGEVTLDWDSVDNADGYIVKYGTSAGNYTEEINVTETTYTVTGLTNGVTYYFVVSASNEVGESKDSDELSATPEGIPNPITINVGEVDAKAGETVTVPVRLEGIEEATAGINACDFKLAFDNSELEVVSVTAGDIIINPSVNLAYNIDNEGAFVSFLFIDTPQKGQEMIFDSGLFVNLEVKVKSTVPAGLSEINVKEVGAFADFDLNEIPTINDNGGVNVIDGETNNKVPAAPVLNSATAGINKVSLGWSSVENADNYTVKYGTSVGNYTEEIDVTETTYTVFRLNSNTTYYFVVSASNEVGESENSNELDITTMTDGTTYQDLTIEIGEITAQPGETVTVPVKLVNVEKPINACDFKIGFDNSALEVISVTAGDIIINPSVNLAYNTDNEGAFVSFLFIDTPQQGEEMIFDSGVFVNLEVKVKSTAPARLSEINVKEVGAFADFDLNEIPVETAAGGITVE